MLRIVTLHFFGRFEPMDFSETKPPFEAAECGKRELAIHLLESETSVSRQVPLLINLGKVCDTRASYKNLWFLFHFKYLMLSSENCLKGFILAWAILFDERTNELDFLSTHFEMHKIFRNLITTSKSSIRIVVYREIFHDVSRKNKTYKNTAFPWIMSPFE